MRIVGIEADGYFAEGRYVLKDTRRDGEVS
jgi:hypothetical protein